MKKAKFIKTNKKISAKVFNLKFDEVIWVNGNKLVRDKIEHNGVCLLYTSPSPRDGLLSRMPSSA